VIFICKTKKRLSMLPTIRIHAQGSYIGYCQNLLNARLKGVPPLWVDRQFGVKTDLAVRHFQAMKLLKTDGKVGLDTWAALEAGPPPIKKRPPEPLQPCTRHREEECKPEQGRASLAL
jgi:peptidoglycan hydrolase-like protein with peptidoglycan-binding domain